MASTSSVDEETAGGQPSLKRVMGPGLLLLFVVGDILGTGVYALTGKVAGEVGGAVWLPFLCAFVVALLTATTASAASYAVRSAQLDSRYPPPSCSAFHGRSGSSECAVTTCGTRC